MHIFTCHVIHSNLFLCLLLRGFLVNRIYVSFRSVISSNTLLIAKLSMTASHIVSKRVSQAEGVSLLQTQHPLFSLFIMQLLILSEIPCPIYKKYIWNVITLIPPKNLPQNTLFNIRKILLNRRTHTFDNKKKHCGSQPGSLSTSISFLASQSVRPTYTPSKEMNIASLLMTLSLILQFWHFFAIAAQAAQIQSLPRYSAGCNTMAPISS